MTVIFALRSSDLAKWCFSFLYQLLHEYSVEYSRHNSDPIARAVEVYLVLCLFDNYSCLLLHMWLVG
jgi:hypothetical protein